MKRVQESLLENLEKEFRIENDASLGHLVNYSTTKDAPIHRWFKYREGYSVDLVGRIIDDSDTKVLDPFCGCGTTLLSSKKRKIPAVGIDINPLSVFVTKVKTENYTYGDLREIKRCLVDLINDDRKMDYEVPSLSIIDKAFHPHILNEILTLKEKILAISNSRVRNFLFLGFLSILESLSNTYKEGNGLKYRFVKRTKEGYIKIPLEKWYKQHFPDDKNRLAREAFRQQVDLMVRDLKNEKLPRTVAKAVQGDSRRISDLLDERDVSLCVFSPPYCNCFDYFEIFKLELWIGDFIKNYYEMRKERKKSLRSNTNSNLSQSCHKISYLEEFIQLINVDELWNKKVADLIRGYFSDMKDVLVEIFKVLGDDGRCFIIVGNSAYGGVLIPTDILLSKIADEIGFKVNRVCVARHLTTSSQQKKSLVSTMKYLRESVVCLQK